MKHSVPAKAVSLASLCLGVALGCSTAVAQTADDLVGAWAWSSVEAKTPDGVTIRPFGATPQGLIIFDRSRRFVWLIARPGRPRFEAKNREKGTPEENKAAMQGSLGYSGTYTVSGKTLLLKVDASTYPNEEGNEQARVFTLDGDELRWANAATSAGTSAVAILRRIK